MVFTVNYWQANTQYEILRRLKYQGTVQAQKKKKGEALFNQQGNGSQVLQRHENVKQDGIIKFTSDIIQKEN